MRVLSWNVNGIRACLRKGFAAWLGAAAREIVGLQEVRAFARADPRRSSAAARWHQATRPAERKGYSGVALLSRAASPTRCDTELAPRFDVEGRMHRRALRAPGGVPARTFPRATVPNRDQSRIPYKLDFYAALLRRLAALPTAACACW